MGGRTASVERDTLETKIRVSVDLDGTGISRFVTGLPFLDHMLDQVARHGLIDLTVEADGDLEIDAHHTVEDIGITLGQAIARAVGDKSGVVSMMKLEDNPVTSSPPLVTATKMVCTERQWARVHTIRCCF